jgi:hypothetical protein
VTGQLHFSVALLWEQEPPVSIWLEAEWVPKLILTLRRREHPLPLPRIEPWLLDHPSCSLVAIPTELSRFFKQSVFRNEKYQQQNAVIAEDEILQ